MERVEYNNSLFSPKGKLNRLFYILHNAFWFIVGFRFIYYPGIMRAIQSSPDFPQLIKLLSTSPQTKALVPYLSDVPSDLFIFIVLKYVCVLILRLVDIKRVRDIVDRKLSYVEQAVIIFVFSLPYIDFLSTCFLAVIPPNKFAKDEFERNVKAKDLAEARQEGAQDMNLKLFKEGKISRAEYEKNRK